MNTDRDYIWAMATLSLMVAGIAAGCMPMSQEDDAFEVTSTRLFVPADIPQQATIGEMGCTLLLNPSPALFDVTAEWAQKFRYEGFDVRIDDQGIPVTLGDLPVNQELCEEQGLFCYRLAQSLHNKRQDGTGLVPDSITIGNWLPPVAVGHAMGHEIGHLLRADHDAGGLMSTDLSIQYIDDATLQQMTSRVTCATEGIQ